jgi:hypothetical protein
MEPERRATTSVGEFFSKRPKRLPRRAFLAGMAAAVVAAAASALGLLKWRARDRQKDEGEPSVAAAGIFGEWLDADGLPAFRYTLDQRSDPRARYAIREGHDSTLNWHHVGNDATAAIATNDGWVQLFDFSHGPRWINAWEPEHGRYAGGFGYVFEDGEVLPTLFLDADPTAPAERIFGTGYFDTRLVANELEIDRRVLLPFGSSTWLLSRVTLRNRAGHARRIRHFEYWDVNPRWLAFGATDEQRVEAAAALEYDVTASTSRITAAERQTSAAEALRKMNPPRVPPEPGPTLFLVPLGGTPVDGFDTDPARFFGAGGRQRPDAVAAGSCSGSTGNRRPCFVAQSDLEIPAHGEATLWFAYGYTYGAIPDLPAEPEKTERESLDAWRSWLPAFHIKGSPDLCRELTWHAYYTRASSYFDAFFGRRTIPQGFWYLYGSGFNAGLRDSVQHALPLVYFEPELARDVLLSVLAQADETGHFPYSVAGFGIALDFIWQPGDYDIWALWLASEYVLATRDTSVLDEALAYYPPDSAATAPVWDHLVRAYHHLVDVVGVGARGLLHARNADWNDGLVFEAAPGDIQGFIRDGESTLASAFAAWVLPHFASVARARGDDALATEVDAFASGLRDRLRQYWTGSWLARAILPAGEIYGTDQLHLEPQPWAIVAGVTDDAQTDVLLDQIDALLRQGSPLGARLYSRGSGAPPSGEATQGGVWLSITHTLIWAAAQRRPDMAWDEFLRNTLANHARQYPDVWVGAWSGPDAYNSDWSSRPGWTWDLPALNVYGQYWPIQNVHTHSQPLMSFLRLAGVEPIAEGLRIAPAMPPAAWSVESPSFALAYSRDTVAGRMSTRGDRIELHVRLPDGLVGHEVRVTGSAATVEHEVLGADVIVRLQGPSGGAWDWRVERPA